VPFEVPESWEWVKISDIGDWQSGATPSRANKEYFNGEILWLKTGDLNDNYVCDIPETITEKALLETSLKINPIGSVLIAMYGATIGKVGILTKPATTNQACCACSNFRGINNLFLFYTLIAYRGYFIGISEGGAQPNISKIKITSTYIPLPPIEEQHRIVREIKRLFELIDTIEENKLSLEDLIVQTKSKILNLAIRGKLVPQNYSDEPAITLLEQIKKRNKSHKTTTDTSHYPFEVPEGWIACQLYEICDFERGVTFPSSAKQTLKRENTIACVRTANVQEQLELDDLWYIDKSFLKNNRKKLLRKNDIIISTANSKELVGKTSFVENINEEMCFGGFVMVIRTNFINNKFLFYYLRDCFYNGIFSKKASQTTNIANINTTILGNLVIKVPPPAEQQRIVNKIEEIFKIVDIMQENLQTNV